MKNSFKKVLLVVSIFILVGGAFIVGKQYDNLNRKILQFTPTLTPNESSLIQTSDKINPVSQDSLKDRYLKYVSFLNSHEFGEAYEFYTAEAKQIESKDNYIINMSKNRVYNQKVSINSITIKDNIGYIDRNTSYCEDVNCTSEKSNRSYKKWIYENSNWYLSFPDPACIRDEMYDMPEEFKRSISIIIQRFNTGNEDDRLIVDDIKSVMNCLNITYANSDSDMHGADGYFTFYDSSPKDNLIIKVSPKYLVKDDVVTAILLSHEITHAVFYANGLDDYNSCYEKEARAFNAQWAFILKLNQGEKESIAARGYTDKVIHDTFYTLQQIQYQKGSNWYEQALNYVKNNDYYIKQCSSQ